MGSLFTFLHMFAMIISHDLLAVIITFGLHLCTMWSRVIKLCKSEETARSLDLTAKPTAKWRAAYS